MKHIRKIITLATAFHLLLWSAGSGLAQAQWPTGPMHSPWNGIFWHWAVIILHVLFWILVLVVLILAIRWLIQNTGGRKTRNGRSPGSAQKILEERYDRGEIDREEFEQRKRDLLS